MDIEMQPIRRNGNDGAAYSCTELVTAGNGAGDAAETHGLLSEPNTRSNGEAVPSDHATEAQRTLGNTFPLQEIASVCSRSRLKLWLIVILIFIFICTVIGVSLAVCAAIYEDADENFDRSLFKVPRSFNGSFRLPNHTFTEELFTLSSNESQALTADLQEKLDDLYRSSPALGRYFSGAEIHAFRNGSVIADYQLTFLMPEEQQDRLINITLSREMVFNVFRQFLNDQEADESGQMLLVQIKTSGGIMGAYNSNLDDVMEEDMHHWYTKFMKESPSGLITLFELKTMLEMTGMTEEASSYVDQVFFTFDMDGDGYMDFVEYIAAISLLLKGEINQKLKWYFKLFDQDGNGKIDKQEMETIFKAIQDITRNYDVPPEDIVTLVYEKIDIHGEGELTLEEFISGARDHPDIMDLLTNMMDLTNVLEIIVRGQQKPAVN